MPHFDDVQRAKSKNTIFHTFNSTQKTLFNRNRNISLYCYLIENRKLVAPFFSSHNQKSYFFSRINAILFFIFFVHFGTSSIYWYLGSFDSSIQLLVFLRTYIFRIIWGIIGNFCFFFGVLCIFRTSGSLKYF